MAVELHHVLETLRDFADADPERVDWEIIGNLVEEHLDVCYRNAEFENERYLDDYLVEDEFDDYRQDDEGY